MHLYTVNLKETLENIFLQFLHRQGFIHFPCNELERHCYEIHKFPLTLILPAHTFIGVDENIELMTDMTVKCS